MRFHHLELGTAPTEEDCVQVGSSLDYRQKQYEEASRFRDLLKSLFPPPEGGSFVIKLFSHDFGPYCEVCAKFDTQSESAIEWAFNVESGLPMRWPT